MASFALCLSVLVVSSTAFAERCVDNGDGTLTDNTTGLMWQKVAAGKMIWVDAHYFHIPALSLGGHSDWRLPTKDELLRLSNSPCKNMMDLHNCYFWSSTINDRFDSVCVVEFGNSPPGICNEDLPALLCEGSDYLNANKFTDKYYVRAVRNAQ